MINLFKTPKILQDAGVLYCLSIDGGWQQRNLAFQAGQAVGFGLKYEEAIQALTLNTAKILGIDKSVGTMEAGKDATLIISEGDALDMIGNHIQHAFIRGKAINLDNKQKELYRKYKKEIWTLTWKIELKMVEDPKSLEDLNRRVKPYRKMLGQAADTVLEQDVSSYPIIIVHNKSIQIGLPLVKPGILEDGWSIHISTLEEFVAKQLIETEKLDSFKRVYKKPTESLCLFVIDDIGATFVFLPRS